MITTTIHRFGIASAMRVGAVLGALSTAVFGLLYFPLVISVLPSLNTGGTGSNTNPLALGLAALCVAYGSVILMSAIGGALGGLITAFLYNLTSTWTGGLTVELRLPDGAALSAAAAPALGGKPKPARGPVRGTRAADDDLSIFN